MDQSNRIFKILNTEPNKIAWDCNVVEKKSLKIKIVFNFSEQFIPGNTANNLYKWLNNNNK